MNTEVVRIQEGVSEKRTPAQLLEKLRSQGKARHRLEAPQLGGLLAGAPSQLYLAETRQRFSS